MTMADARSGDGMIEENDGTGDGECGKLMWMMGVPMDGCPGWVDTAVDAGTCGADAWMEGLIGDVEEISEMNGPKAESCGMPP